MTDEEKIREFERTLLDKIHLKKEFINYSENLVIPYLLQTYGDFVRHKERFITQGHTETSLNIFYTNLLHGIGHCIRWIKQQQTFKYDSISSFQLAQELATDFANWGIAYHMIAQEFIAWSRGVKGVELNETTKTITFTLPGNFDYSRIFGQQRSYRNQMIQTYNGYPEEEIQAEYHNWLESIKLVTPPLANVIDWTKAKSSAVYPVMLDRISHVILPELSGTTDMGGYSLSDLRVFYTLFFLQFSFITWIEQVIDSDVGTHNSYGSNPLYLERSQFIQLAGTVNNLDATTNEKIIDDLTFNNTNFHSSLSTQPFVRSKSGIYYILPNLFVLVEPSRMIAGAFSKEKKTVYDSIINQIEAKMLSRLDEKIRSSGRLCLTGLKLKVRGKTISPDIIIIEQQSRSLLVIDYKHFIGPITASEVVYKISELRKGIDQVTNYTEVLKKIDSVKGIEIKDYEVYALLLTHKPLPVPAPLSNRVRITDSVSFLDLISKSSDLSLSELVSFFKPIESSPEQFKPIDDTIAVEDWTIVRKMFKRT